MYPEVLKPAARQLLVRLVRELTLRPFYLAGGTALALQFGHRRSVDFDWFSQRPFRVAPLTVRLAKLGRFSVTSEDSGTLHGVLGGVRLSFLHYPYPLLWPAVPYEGAPLADSRDIACMKLQAAAGRGSRKDFIDLYVLLRRYPLAKLMVWFKRKYRGVDYSSAHLLKSLVYFSQADAEPNPVLLEPIRWSEVKRTLRAQVAAYMKIL